MANKTKDAEAERTHFLKVIQAFKNYSLDSKDRIRRTRSYLKDIPSGHQRLLSKHAYQVSVLCIFFHCHWRSQQKKRSACPFASPLKLGICLQVRPAAYTRGEHHSVGLPILDHWKSFPWTNAVAYLPGASIGKKNRGVCPWQVFQFDIFQ